MLEALGKTLRAARSRKKLSLEAIAQPASISAAYLHKLERGGVDSPSPRVLARLAAVLDIAYLDLMKLAGYLDEEQLAAARRRSTETSPHPLENQALSEEEWRKVGAFIRTLIAARDLDGVRIETAPPKKG